MTLLDEVRLDLGESSSLLGTYFWSTTEVCNAINAAAMAAYIDVDDDTATGTITATASAHNTDLPINSVMIPKRVLDTNQKEIFATSLTDLEIYKTDWYSFSSPESLAPPKWIAPVGFEEVVLWPAPDQSYNYTLYGVAWPGEVSEGSPDLTIHDQLKDAIVALAIAFLVDDYYPELCDIKYMEYMQFISSYKRTLRNRRGRTPVALKPSGRFNRARSGSIQLGSWYK